MDWRYEYTPSIWPAILSTAFPAVLAIYGCRRRSVPGAVSFSALMMFGALWALSYALELSAVDQSQKILWAKVQSAWQLPMVTAELWFALEYADLRHWLTRRNFIFLALPPLAWLLLISTNDIHSLVWSGFSFQGSIHPERNAVAWAFIAYGYGLGLMTILIFVQLLWRSPPHRVPVALCLCGQIAVRAAYGLKTAGVISSAPLDPVALSFDFGALMFACALFRFRLFSLIPIARGTVIDQMREGMLVLDCERRIVDLNPSAERILGVSAACAKGKDAVQLLRDVSELTDLLASPDGKDSDLSIRIGPSSRYALQMSLLKERHGHPLGRLILFHDVTEQTLAQAQLLEQQRAVATLEERDRIARELHDSIGQVLGYVKMQGQAARQLLSKGQLPQADGYLARLVAVVQEAHADVREYILGARSGLSDGVPFVPALDDYLHRFGESYGIVASLSAEPGLDGDKLEPMVAAQLLRIIQETLTNVRKHARASRVRVQLAITDGFAEATVQDDGVGFNPEMLEAAPGQRYGLLFMRDRAQQVGGSIDVRSGPGQGTMVIIRVPVRKEQV